MTLNAISVKRLEGVHRHLVAIVERVAAKRRIVVVEGLRTVDRQRDLYAQGRTTPGKVVTWTMKSKHIDGLAVDVAPLDERGVIDWNNTDAFISLGADMLEAARELGFPLRWGYDWNGNGKLREKGESDGPHFELL